jgi:hypothetical protein
MALKKERKLGPYSAGQESRFKADYIKHRGERDGGWRYFRIETEETENGFPDVLALHRQGYILLEFKVSDPKGVVSFRRSQLAFYRRNPDLAIGICAWHVPSGRSLCIGARRILDAKTLRVNLTPLIAREGPDA